LTHTVYTLADNDVSRVSPVGWFQSFLRSWSASVESATYISSSNKLCRDF